MKTRFTAILFVMLICIFYTSLSAIAVSPSKEKTLSTPDKDLLLEEGCMRSCLSDYSKIIKCDLNKMMGQYLAELNNEN